MGVQLELAQAIHKLGKKMIVVYINGRPIVEPWLEEHADAIIEAWYPGQEGGTALAEILFGDVNPSGRLTLSIPKDVGQLPVYYNAKRSRSKRYLEMDTKPLYPFGYGLSYTTFAYSEPEVSPAAIMPDGEATVTVHVTNTGEAAGTEVVQLYITDVVSSVTRPVKELKGFERVSLAPGETKAVQFTVGPEQLQMLDARLQPVVEPGVFKLTAGSHAETGKVAHLTVLGKE